MIISATQDLGTVNLQEEVRELSCSLEIVKYLNCLHYYHYRHCYHYCYSRVFIAICFVDCLMK